MGFADELKAKASELLDDAKDVFEDAKDKVGDLYEGAKDKVEDVFHGDAADAVKDSAADVADKAKDVADDAAGTVTDAVDDATSSRITDEGADRTVGALMAVSAPVRHLPEHLRPATIEAATTHDDAPHDRARSGREGDRHRRVPGPAIAVREGRGDQRRCGDEQREHDREQAHDDRQWPTAGALAEGVAPGWRHRDQDDAAEVRTDPERGPGDRDGRRAEREQVLGSD